MASSTLFDDLLGGGQKPIEVLLDAYVLPDDHGVWKCFPGQTYRFLEAVKAANTVFLDIRGLEIFPRDPSEWKDQELLARIASDRWSRELEKADRGIEPRGSPDISGEDRKRYGFLKGLIFDVKRGDLIVLPADGYRREVLIGEVIDEPGTFTLVEANDGDRTGVYVGRRVRWLPSKEKRAFSAQVIGSLHSSTAFHTIGKSVRKEIYEVAYRNFILGDLFVATFQTTKQQFTTSDNAVVSVWFNALAAAYSASNSFDSDLAGRSFSDLGLLRSAEAERGELSIDIASPGSVLLHSAGVFALAAMTLFPMMQLDAATIVAAPVVVHVHTVGHAGPSCALQIAEAAKGIAQTLSVERLQHACEVGQRAMHEATLHTKAHLISHP